jgi:hypothetical protein
MQKGHKDESWKELAQVPVRWYPITYAACESSVLHGNTAPKRYVSGNGSQLTYPNEFS